MESNERAIVVSDYKHRYDEASNELKEIKQNYNRDLTDIQ